MMERVEIEQTENKDGKEQPGLLVAMKYFVMQEVAMENLQMRDV